MKGGDGDMRILNKGDGSIFYLEKTLWRLSDSDIAL